MAVTGMKGVSGSLDRSIAYVTNPQKTECERKPEDSELSWGEPAIESGIVRYVAGINCSTRRAYEEMTAIREQYDRPGHNIAYHGYQSFRKGEITPEEALVIAKKTARILWGRDYQVLISVHTNTTHIHSHFLINSVSFRTHAKFQNSRQNMMNFRTVSDRICLMHGKTIVRHPQKNPSKKLQKYLAKGGKTITDYMLDEIRFYAQHTESLNGFFACMYLAGYEYDAQKNALRFPGRSGFTSLDRIPGLNRGDLPMEHCWLPVYEYDYTPLPVYESRTFAVQQYLLDHPPSGNEPAEAVLTRDPSETLTCIVRSLQEYLKEPQCLSILAPEFRAEKKNLNALTEVQEFLTRENIHTPEGFTRLAERNMRDLMKARKERNLVYQRMYHVRNPQLKEKHASAYSEQKKKVEELAERQKALQHLGKSPRQMLSALQHLSAMLTKERYLEKERTLERQKLAERERLRTRERSRGYER